MIGQRKIYGFEKLDVYNDARQYVKQIYLLTELFPDKERFGLCSQIQRTSVSIVSNIAEGTLIALNSRSFPNSLSHPNSYRDGNG